jgi:hypothetical protein
VKRSFSSRFISISAFMDEILTLYGFFLQETKHNANSKMKNKNLFLIFI